MKKIIFIIIILFGVIFSFLNINSADTKIYTPNKKYNVLLADTNEKRIQGLSGLEKIKNNEVMLFVFEEEDLHGIWMKDMLFNIDLVFLDKDLNVINYFDNVSYESYPTIYYPESKSKYIIEMNAGQRLVSGIDKNTKIYYK